MTLLDVRQLQKTFTTRFGGHAVTALKNISFSVNQGEFVAIMGESGSGKTTLLNVIAGLEKPTNGDIIVEGTSLAAMSQKDLAAFRRTKLGFVFQDFNLLPTFSLEDNILLPLVLSGTPKDQLAPAIRPLANQLNLQDIITKFPYEVSGGQQQRAAVARALITKPSLILADEPTGALDSHSSQELLRLFGQLNLNDHTLLMVTHSISAASHANRVLFIKDGVIFHQVHKGNRTQQLFFEDISNTITAMARGSWQDTI